jgi:glutathione synthase/RimK-type ligase-like ATP-grasp enzyme
MKIGIHPTKDSFSEFWIAYCNANNISYKLVNCYKPDIISQLSDCDALMWAFSHVIPSDIIFAKQLLYALESTGKYIFPDFNTMWHFDDKIGQKYLLEAIKAPLVPTHIFYSKREALHWISKTEFPKVFKLRGGASSHNVKLARTEAEAIRLVKRAFKSGFNQFSAYTGWKESVRKYRIGKSSFMDVVRSTVRIVYRNEYNKFSGKEKGYIYFQDFVPDNDHDIRIIVIDGKAFAIKRMVRTNDFRASGSGNIHFEKNIFDERMIRLSFDLAEKLKTQCVAFDFVSQSGIPMVVEMSFGFALPAYNRCPGFWDEELNWHEGEFNPGGWMVEKVVREATRKAANESRYLRRIL